MRKNLIGGVPFSPAGGRVLRSPTPAEVFGSGGGSGGPNVKKASDRFSDVRYEQRHVKTGLPVVGFDGAPVRSVSQRDAALLGAWVKNLFSRQPNGGVPLTEFEKELAEEAYCGGPWSGGDGDKYVNGAMRTKADLLGDTISGGSYVSPLWFDAAVVTYPLLYGELMPMIDLVEMPISKTVKSATIGNPTCTWGTAESASLTPFDATDLINEIDATVYPCACALKISRDLLADSIVNLGQILATQIGQSMMAELDEVIAMGAGSQPSGLFIAGGTAAVSSINGTSGPLAVSDAEALIFGLPKQYRRKDFNPCFIGSDSMYRKMRSLPVGVNDQRRIFGHSYSDYAIGEYPFKINNEIPEGTVGFAAMKKAYRLWRRAGMEVRFETGGVTLNLANEALLMVRQRFAGKVVDVSAVAVMSDAAAAG